MEKIDWNKLLSPERLRDSKRPSKNPSIDPRNEFESDFGRIIFSPAIRRMHDKTQVFPLTTDDNIHSRLTHSLEVMSVGYSLGIKLLENDTFLKKTGLEKEKSIREIPIILKNICLIHDIGNPPFGHFGEEAIRNFFKNYFKNIKTPLSALEREDFICFDGNAQGFRVLTKLQVLDDQYGLNLTYATLASYLKYPNPNKINKGRLCLKKRGVFQSERDYLKKIFEECKLKSRDQYKRHPLSYLMEAADSICYLVMDIEDGFNKNWYSINEFRDFILQYESEKDFKKIPKELIEKIFSFKEEEPENKKMVTSRINLISYFVDLAHKNFIKNYENICYGEYNKELIFDDENKVAQALQNFCNENIFPKKDIISLELTGNSVIEGLLNYYMHFIFHENSKYRKKAIGLISRSIKNAAFYENNIDTNCNFEELNFYYKIRVIVDFISGMTDQYALNHYQKLSGQKII
ncbi:dGTP triphosphohydrolase [Thermophagus sp. OGC60D27]|uniref:dGTP triphosphohydrolase n=1 Tax=Thermophagus sp. OGC60D27 TaxID=3458415 RepID=UPI0040376E94